MVELVFILDRSGSMERLTKDTIGGFNSMLEKQRIESGKAFVTTVLFNDEIRVVHDRISIDKVLNLTEEDYFACGCTALLDAIGETIHHISNIHKYARKEDLPKRTLFIITTDGMENSSHKYTYDMVHTMIEEKKKHGWEFLFLGANMDAITEAKKFGIDESMTANYNNDEIGTELNYDCISEAISSVRKCSKPLSSKWKRKIDDDYKNRRGGK